MNRPMCEHRWKNGTQCLLSQGGHTHNNEEKPTWVRNQCVDPEIEAVSPRHAGHDVRPVRGQKIR